MVRESAQVKEASKQFDPCLPSKEFRFHQITVEQSEIQLQMGYRPGHNAKKRSRVRTVWNLTGLAFSSEKICVTTPIRRCCLPTLITTTTKAAKMVSAKTRPNAPRIFSNTSAVVTECSELRSSLRNFESQNEYGYKPCIKRRFQNAETLQSRNQKNSS